jgi:hypothetical protein
MLVWILGFVSCDMAELLQRGEIVKIEIIEYGG